MDNSFEKVFSQYHPDRGSLIPLLQDIQEEKGFISQEAVSALSQFLNISKAEIYGVATFYTQFVFTKPGKHKIKICQGTACHVRKSTHLSDEIFTLLGIKPGETTKDGKFSLESVSCLGSCALAPVIVIDEKVYGRMTLKKLRQIIKEVE